MSTENQPNQQQQNPPPAPPTPSWTEGFNDELKGFVENRGFKDPASVVDAYRNLEKLRGVPRERLLTIPEKDDAPEWNDVFEKLGRPKDATEYGIKAEGEGKAFAEWAQKTFFEANLTKKQAATFAAKWDEYFKGQQTAAQEATQAKLAEQEGALKKEWGAAFEQNVGVVKQAAVALGITGEQMDALESALGLDGAMKLLHQVGSKVGEAGFVTGRSQGFGVLTPNAAQQRIKDLRADPAFVRRYTEGDREARDEMAKLHKWAYPEA